MLTFRYGLMAACLLLSSGCVPSAPVTQPSAASEAPSQAVTELAQWLKGFEALPGATLATVEGRPALYYAGETLFAQGAVLPLPGGGALLDPLAEAMRSTPGGRWQVKVAAHSGEGPAYDQRLAAKRGELLMIYLTRRGVERERLEVVVDLAAEAPVTLVFQPSDGGSNSAREKE